MLIDSEVNAIYHAWYFLADSILKYFSDFTQETGFKISDKLSLIESVCVSDRNNLQEMSNPVFRKK